MRPNSFEPPESPKLKDLRERVTRLHNEAMRKLERRGGRREGALAVFFFIVAFAGFAATAWLLSGKPWP